MKVIDTESVLLTLKRENAISGCAGFESCGHYLEDELVLQTIFFKIICRVIQQLLLSFSIHFFQGVFNNHINLH
jgi:hypothetical protein